MSKVHVAEIDELLVNESLDELDIHDIKVVQKKQKQQQKDSCKNRRIRRHDLRD